MSRERPAHPQRLLTLDEVAELLQIPPRTLYAQRHRGVHPGSLGIRVGRHVRYRPEALADWLDTRPSANEGR